MFSDRASLAKLVALLWNSYRGDIESGDPVFFSFSRESLAFALQGSEFQSNDCVSTICNAANELISIRKHSVELTQTALDENESGFSGSIILVALQVMAVESMVDDPNGFSDNAYFPRLRRLISASLGEISQNPFEFSEFESIWRVFAREIRSFKNSTEASITFKFGDESKINKARSFPLSQALLTQEDLVTLVRRIGQKVIASGEPAQIWREISNESVHLGRRARRLLSIAYLRPRVIDQLRAFARAVTMSRVETAARSESGDKLVLGFFKESIDWRTQEFRPLLFRQMQRETVEDQATIQQHIDRLFDSRSSLCVPLGELGDCWLRSSSPVRVLPGDVFVVLSKSGSQPVIGSREVNEQQAFEIVSSAALCGYEPYQVSEFVVKESAPSGLVIAADRISTSFATEEKYKWVGGICVNRRTTCFLRDALPKSVVFEDAAFELESLVAINQRSISYSHFIDMLSREVSYSQYEIEFPGDRIAKIAVGVQRDVYNERIGFSLSLPGGVASFANWIPPHATALVGNVEPELPVSISHSTELNAKLIAELLNQWPAPPSAEQVVRIDATSNSGSIPSPIRHLLKSLRYRADKFPVLRSREGAQ